MMPRLAPMLLLASLAVTAQAAFAREVTGALSYPARIALPPDAVALLDLRRDGESVATARIVAAGRQVPLPFRLDGVPEGALTLHATIHVANRPRWSLDAAPVPAGAGAADLGLLVLGPAGGVPVAFVARGNEPGWRLDLTAGDLTLTTEDGTRLSLPRPAGDAGDLRADGLTIRATPDLCRDTMTGMPYPLSVRVTAGARDLAGCGGDPAALLDGPWQLRRMGDTPLPDGLFLAFAAGRVTGSAGCNRLTGALQVGGEGVTLGPLAVTRMACPEGAMATERQVLAALDRTDGFDFDGEGRLVLTAGGQPVLQAER